MSYTCPPMMMERNLGTQVIAMPWSIPQPPTQAEVFERHHRRLAKIVAAAPAGASTLAAVYCDTSIAAHAHVIAGASDSASMVIGRHDHAGLSLWRDPSIALRHLLARFRCSSAGRASVDLLDLNSGQGFDVQGIGCVGGLCADGPVFVRIGRYDMLVAPPMVGGWPDDVHDAWDLVSTPTQTHVRPSDRWAPGAPKGPARGSVTTNVTLRPTALSLSEASRPGVEVDSPVALLGIPGPSGEGVAFPLSEEHVARGVLLGRYDRCQVLPIGMAGVNSVSRVHGLLIREGEEIVLYDVGSTFGTFVNGRQVQSARLGDSATLELGPGNVVYWRRTDVIAGEHGGGYVKLSRAPAVEGDAR